MNTSAIHINIAYLKTAALTSHDVLSRPWFLPFIHFQKSGFYMFRVNLVLSRLFLIFIRAVHCRTLLTNISQIGTNFHATQIKIIFENLLTFALFSFLFILKLLIALETPNALNNQWMKRWYRKICILNNRRTTIVQFAQENTETLRLNSGNFRWKT